MHTLAALPPGEGGGASELAFPVGDWERDIAMKAIAHPKDEADKGTSSVQVPNSPFI
ncbi:hypothetical protein [Nostoc sp.]|uniref:hypothetical protein n=1 Tax=Nostoc sp. TaxID=1180 RepID=UPI002FF9B64D